MLITYELVPLPFKRGDSVHLKGEMNSLFKGAHGEVNHKKNKPKQNQHFEKLP